VGVRPSGRERVYYLETSAIDEVADWAKSIQAEISRRFDALGHHLDAMEKKSRGR
jgi:hypothetical protein